MPKRRLAIVPKDTIRKFEAATNKYQCAQQAACPGFVPEYIPPVEAERIFKETLFALADAEYLLNIFWRDLEIDYPLIKDIEKENLFIDYVTHELYTMEKTA
jgi:hypothetical protein